ncbi:hypothetical protein EJB05_41444 [Eragrostis curvula]|uniref:Uncharacterized protein n=1 Tax=Eragrostis curvula TaxID=38414 RepID=A0A5J9T9Q6_9POAL|nr:hypothetical protein EJB05_41444 [Eragrostis curvula]
MPLVAAIICLHCYLCFSAGDRGASYDGGDSVGGGTTSYLFSNPILPDRPPSCAIILPPFFPPFSSPEDEGTDGGTPMARSDERPLDLEGDISGDFVLPFRAGVSRKKIPSPFDGGKSRTNQKKQLLESIGFGGSFEEASVLVSDLSVAFSPDDLVVPVNFVKTF